MMLFAVYFVTSKRVSFLTDKESIAINHVKLLDDAGERIYDYQPIKDGDDYEVPFIG
jgi:hypothetical protein